MDDLQTLLRPLVDRPETAPEPVEWLARRARRRAYRRRGLTVTTAALLLAVPVLVVLQRDPSTVDLRTGPSTTVPSTSSTAPSSTTTTLPPDPFGSAAPWAGPSLPASAAPAYVAAAAASPEGATKCPIVASDDLGEGAGATPRMATWSSSDLWGVEYDLAGAPGEPEDHALPTPDAGRATFSVGASVMPPVPDPAMAEAYGITSPRELITDRPQVHSWSDGSVVGWGHGLVDAAPGALTPPEPVPGQPEGSWVQFQVQGADPSCLYSVSSYLGQDHVFHLVEQLRRVDGL